MCSRLLRIAMLAAVTMAVSARGVARACDGDFNGDGRVTINEVITTVNNGLFGCPTEGPATPTPRPERTNTAVTTPTQVTVSPTSTLTPTQTPIRTPSPGRGFCGGSFFADNAGDADLPVCGFGGRWNDNCGHGELVVGWVSDGFHLVFGIVDPEIFFGGQTIDRNNARLTGWWTRPDGSDFRPWQGTAAMTPDTVFLRISPIGAPFSIGGCPFEGYLGRYFTDLPRPLGASGAATATTEFHAALQGGLDSLKRRSDVPTE